MTQNYSEPFSNIPQDSEALRSVPNDSETVRIFPKDSEADGSVPQRSEDNGTIPHRAESVRNVPQDAEGREDHTLTVQEVARMFENAGVPRTERCIVNWCHRHGNDIGRLDCVMDGNERRYFISQESVGRAIEEEKSKAARIAEKVGSIRKEEEPKRNASEKREDDDGEVDSRRLKAKIRDLELTNGMKDKYIERLEIERKDMVEDIKSTSRLIGQLETRLQLEEPKMTRPAEIESDSESMNSFLREDIGDQDSSKSESPEPGREA